MNTEKKILILAPIISLILILVASMAYIPKLREILLFSLCVVAVMLLICFAVLLIFFLSICYAMLLTYLNIKADGFEVFGTVFFIIGFDAILVFAAITHYPDKFYILLAIIPIMLLLITYITTCILCFLKLIKVRNSKKIY